MIFLRVNLMIIKKLSPELIIPLANAFKDWPKTLTQKKLHLKKAIWLA